MPSINGMEGYFYRCGMSDAYRTSLCNPEEKVRSALQIRLRKALTRLRMTLTAIPEM